MARKLSLTDMTNKKPAAASEQPETEMVAEMPRGKKRAGLQADGRKGILIRVETAGWRELRDLAAELTIKTGEQVSMQSLITDAINDLLRQHGRPPVA